MEREYLQFAREAITLSYISEQDPQVSKYFVIYHYAAYDRGEKEDAQ